MRKSRKTWKSPTYWSHNHLCVYFICISVIFQPFWREDIGIYKKGKNLIMFRTDQPSMLCIVTLVYCVTFLLLTLTMFCLYRRLSQTSDSNVGYPETISKRLLTDPEIGKHIHIVPMRALSTQRNFKRLLPSQSRLVTVWEPLPSLIYLHKFMLLHTYYMYLIFICMKNKTNIATYWFIDVIKM